MLELYGVNEYMFGLYDFASEEEKAAISEETLDKGLAYYHRAMREVIYNAGTQDFIMWSANWYRNNNMHHKVSHFHTLLYRVVFNHNFLCRRHSRSSNQV